MKRASSNIFKNINGVYDYFINPEDDIIDDVEDIGLNEIDIKWDKYLKTLKTPSIDDLYILRLTNNLSDIEFKENIIEKIIKKTKKTREEIEREYFVNNNEKFAKKIKLIHGEIFYKYTLDDYTEDYEEWLNNKYEKFQKDYNKKKEKEYLLELKKQKMIGNID